MEIRIVGAGLPGRTFGDPHPGGCRYDNVHVGLQRRREVVDLVPGDAREAAWDLAVDVSEAGSTVDFRGPFVHGRPGDRFLYLSWGSVDDAGHFEMFRRAKLMLHAVDVATVRAADRPGWRLATRLGLTGAGGGPLCASVRPPAVDWTAEPA